VDEPTGGTGLGHRQVRLERTGPGAFDVLNERGGRLHLGDGKSSDFTAVELLLAAIAGCSSVDVDAITGRRARPEQFEVRCEGDKVRDEDGNHLTGIEVSFTVRFPDGPDGDRAREMLPRAVQMSHDRLCTVTRTVVLPTEVTSHLT
jgi:putative redox protein